LRRGFRPCRCCCRCCCCCCCCRGCWGSPGASVLPDRWRQQDSCRCRPRLPLRWCPPSFLVSRPSVGSGPGGASARPLGFVPSAPRGSDKSTGRSIPPGGPRRCGFRSFRGGPSRIRRDPSRRCFCRCCHWERCCYCCWCWWWWWCCSRSGCHSLSCLDRGRRNHRRPRPPERRRRDPWVRPLANHNLPLYFV